MRLFGTFFTTTYLFTFVNICFGVASYFDIQILISLTSVKLLVPYLTLFLTFWLGMFWKEKKQLHNKWEYLANIYNDILKLEPVDDPTKYNARKLLELALASDILIMDMWGHKSYKGIFESLLFESIKYGSTPITRGIYNIKIFENSGVPKKVARNHIRNYQALIRDNKINKIELDQHIERFKHNASA